MTLYYIALILLIVRVVSFGTTWAFIDGSYELLGNFIAEGFILIALMQLMKKAKNGEIYRQNLEEHGKLVKNLTLDKSDTM